MKLTTTVMFLVGVAIVADIILFIGVILGLRALGVIT